MRARCRTLDWAATPLGRAEAWPPGLQVVVGTVLASAFPMVLLWGDALTQVYNDGYRDLMGAKHPAGLGQPTRECWPEVWHLNAPIYERVRAGETVVLEDALYPILRSGVLEEAWFTLSYSPVPDDAGEVGGVLVTVFETTAQVRARDAREVERERLLSAERAAAAELRAVLESMTDAVYIGGASGITLANQAALDQLGFATRAELNRGIATLAAEIQTRDAATGAFIPAGEQAFTRALGGERVVQDVVVRHRVLGEDRVVRCAAAPVLLDGRVVAAVAVNTDVTDRRFTEARLREAEARYLALFNAIDQGFCTIEVKFDERDHPVDYRFLEVSPSFERQTGIRDGAGRWMRDIAPDQDEHWFERYGRVARTGESERFEEHSTPLGRWWSVYAFRIGDPAQRRIGVLFHDVSERKRAEGERERLLAELGAERERLRSVILHTPAPLALLEGPEHRFALVNDAYKRVSGGGRDVTGLTPREAFPELAGSGIYEFFDRVYETGTPWDGPESLLRYDRDGTGVQDTWFNLRFEPMRDAAGQVVAILNFAVDVSEQVRARREVERLLAESERAAQVMSRVTTHLAEGICLMDADGRLTYMNPAAERILGWTEDELHGDVLHDRVHYKRPDGRPFPVRECPLWRVLSAAEAVLGLADQWIRKDGSFVHVVTTCSPIMSDGAVTGAVLSLHDDTERRRAEAERERLLAATEAAREVAEAARVEAEAANRAKSEFLAVMSHELRTPLNAIGGYAELIELGIHGPVTEAQRTALERIQRSQRHLLGLIAGVLDYSRVEAGAVAYHVVDVPVTEAVAEAETLVAPQLRAAGLGYAWSGAVPGLCVRADREKLQQILLNLLGNAVKFTHPRDGVPGRIEVACTVDAGVDGKPVGGRVRLHVRDTGDGIAPESLGRIFEPFVQADQRLTRPHSGVGLGLAISRDLARGMGGDLTAESTPGVGSTFTLTLPRA